MPGPAAIRGGGTIGRGRSTIGTGILYSTAFQRLAYVTQVTAPESGHIFHNRLSHSFKVAQVGRRNAERLIAIARAGGLDGAAAALVETLDPDAVEASCLAHDLGHPPFGHIAEEVLSEVGGEYLTDSFEGNAQSFRIVTRLAQRGSGSGLNLTRQTLDGLLKYPWRRWIEDPLGRREAKWGYYEVDAEHFEFARALVPAEAADVLPQKSLEAHVMEWADDVTYAVHDVDDFFRAGLIPLDRLGTPAAGMPESDDTKRLRELLLDARAAAPERFPKYDVETLVGAIALVADGPGPTGAYRHTDASRREMRRFGSDLITRYLGAFQLANGPGSGLVKLLIAEDAELEVAALKLLAYVYVVRRPGLAVVQHGQQRVMRDLFGYYMTASEADPKKGGDRRIFPPGAKETLEEGSDEPASRVRVVIDLLSGLTEESAIQLHHRLSGGGMSTTLDATAQMG